MNWKKIKDALANAFAYDDGREEISQEDLALLDKAADWIVRRRLTMPAILVLESTGPLSFIGSSLMTFFRPMVGVLFDTTEYQRLERLLEKRCSVGLLVERIEQREQQKKAGRKDAPPLGPPDGDRAK